MRPQGRGGAGREEHPLRGKGEEGWDEELWGGDKRWAVTEM